MYIFSCFLPFISKKAGAEMYLLFDCEDYMEYKELKEIIERNRPQNKCKRCVWGRTIVDDKKNDVVNVMCMFPKCIKDKKEK